MTPPGPPTVTLKEFAARAAGMAESARRVVENMASKLFSGFKSCAEVRQAGLWRCECERALLSKIRKMRGRERERETGVGGMSSGCVSIKETRQLRRLWRKTRSNSNSAFGRLPFVQQPFVLAKPSHTNSSNKESGCAGHSESFLTVGDMHKSPLDTNTSEGQQQVSTVQEILYIDR